MIRPAAILAFAGRHGPALLCAGVAIGFAWPALAAATRPLMDAAVFCFTLGAFLKVDLAAFRAEAGANQAGRNLLLLGWTTFGVPACTWAAIQLAAPGPELAEGLLLCTLAPPVGSAAALAAMLGLNAPIALLASVAATIAAPLYMPVLAAQLGGYALHIDQAGMALRLLVIVGGAAAVSWGMRRFAPRLVRDNPMTMTGIAVAALVVFAIGAMHGMPAYFALQPGLVLGYLAIAFAVNAGFQLLGALFFARCGRPVALTVGLVSGNRNIGLAWAAVGSGMPPLVEVFFAMSVFPIYLLPALTKRLLRVPAAPSPAIPSEAGQPGPVGMLRQARQAAVGLAATRHHPAE